MNIDIDKLRDRLGELELMILLLESKIKDQAQEIERLNKEKNNGLDVSS